MTAKAAVNLNKNVNWMDSRGFWTFYVVLLGCLYAVVSVFVPASEAWTHVGLIHGLISFSLMHWIKGSPDDAMGDYRGLTLYEQIDEGREWTPTKKFLIVVPTALFMAASIATDYDIKHLSVNLPVWLTLVLAKLPALYRVRIFGINATVGIDDAKEET